MMPMMSVNKAPANDESMPASTRCAAVVAAVVLLLTGCGQSTEEATRPAEPSAAEAGAEQAVAPGDPNVVTTTAGPVRGETVDGVRVFRGIPYAAPPVGELRWQPPQSPAAWTEPRDALAFGTPCWQPSIEGFYGRGPIERSEDCLYLNVWTRADADAALPVMVWIHGGALQIGHGHLPMYDGAVLTGKDVVLVSINYRLGALGYLAHEGLSAESPNGVSGNYGILDQAHALEWVRDNIAAFGGDPGNVTIFGESAGSWSVCYLYSSPLAKGLFQRAIGQSGGCFSPHPQLAADSAAGQSGHAAGASLAELLGAADVAAMRAVPAADMYAKMEQESWNQGSRIVYQDGYVFPMQMADLVAAGSHNRVPLLLGSTADEGTTLFMELPDEEDAWRQSAQAFAGDGADAILAAYADDAAASFKTAQQQLLSDQYFAWEMRTWARRHTAGGDPAWLYYFSHVPDLGGEHGTSLGAFHAAEIPYAFGNIHLGFGDGGEALAQRESDAEVARLMTGYWTNFAKHGDPNGADLPTWPAYQEETDLALEINAAPAVVAELRKEKLDAIDGVYAARSQTAQEPASQEPASQEPASEGES